MKNRSPGTNSSTALVLILIVGIACVAYRQMRPIEATPVAPGVQVNRQIDSGPVKGENRLAPIATAPGRAAATPVPSGPASLPQSEDHRDPRLAPNSPAEADWLKAHGYPDQLEREALASYSEDTLRTKTQAGDLLAKVELAKRLAQRDSGTEPLQLLLDAATAGSLHAVVTLGDVHAHAGASYRNPVLASSYYIAAGMLGDFGAIAASNWFVASGFDTQNQRAALMLAAQFVQNLQENRRLTSGTTPVIVPRPGFSDVTNTIIQAMPTPESNRDRGG